ncbi:MAG: beta-ketoacyl synthase N-terminal-like domain-containing protein [Candidatus Lokiarchaeota archaeon]
MGKLSKKVAMIGAGMSKFGQRFPEKRNPDLWVDAWLDAVNRVDNGIEPKDVDALYVGNYSSDLFNHQGHLGPQMANLVGLTPKPAPRMEGACASSGVALRQAILGIASGAHDVIAVCGVETMTEVSTTLVTDTLATASDNIFEYPAGATFPGLYAAIASAHFAKYGTTSEDLMRVGIKNHENGKQNPYAHMQQSIKDIMESKTAKYKEQGRDVPDWKDEFDFLRSSSNPMIASPLRLFDCSLVTDGAACVFLASEEVAKKFTDTPIWIEGSGQGSAALSLHDRENLTSFIATKEASKKAYEMAGMGPKDIQFAEVHDCFTIAEILAIEDLGFYEKGKAVEAIRAGETKRDGSLPINASGGLKSKGHPVGATGAAMAVEIFKQMRGIAERNRQIKDVPEVGLMHNLGGSGGTCVVNIFKR